MAKVPINSLVFTWADLIKLLGFLTVIISMWVDLKADQIHVKANNKIIQYRLAALDKCCGIIPKPITIEEDEPND